jgi:hypothetical protein
MVVRMKSSPKRAPATSSSSSTSSSPASSPDPLRGVQDGSGVEKVTSSSSTAVEFQRLKNLVPSISRKTTVSKLDVILEAIRYIDQLQEQLLDQIAEKRLNPQIAADLLVGKENTNTEILERLCDKRRANHH